MVSKGKTKKKILLKGGIQMKHKLKINVANESPKEGIVACKKEKGKKRIIKKTLRSRPR